MGELISASVVAHRVATSDGVVGCLGVLGVVSTVSRGHVRLLVSLAEAAGLILMVLELARWRDLVSGLIE